MVQQALIQDIENIGILLDRSETSTHTTCSILANLTFNALCLIKEGELEYAEDTLQDVDRHHATIKRQTERLRQVVYKDGERRRIFENDPGVGRRLTEIFQDLDYGLIMKRTGQARDLALLSQKMYALHRDPDAPFAEISAYTTHNNRPVRLLSRRTGKNLGFDHPYDPSIPAKIDHLANTFERHLRRDEFRDILTLEIETYGLKHRESLEGLADIISGHDPRLARDLRKTIQWEVDMLEELIPYSPENKFYRQIDYKYPNLVIEDGSIHPEEAGRLRAIDLEKAHRLLHPAHVRAHDKLDPRRSIQLRRGLEDLFETRLYDGRKTSDEGEPFIWYYLVRQAHICTRKPLPVAFTDWVPEQMRRIRARIEYLTDASDIMKYPSARILRKIDPAWLLEKAQVKDYQARNMASFTDAGSSSPR